MATIKDLADEIVVSVLEYLRAMDLAFVSEVDKKVFSRGRVFKAVEYQMDNIYTAMGPVKGWGGRGVSGIHGSGSSDSDNTPVKESRDREGREGRVSIIPSAIADSPCSPYGSLTPPSPLTLGGYGVSGGGGPLGSGVPGPGVSNRGCTDYVCDVLYVAEIKSILLALTSASPVSGKRYWVSTSWVANAKKYFEALNLPDINTNNGRNGGGNGGGRGGVWGGGGSGGKAGGKRMSKIRARRGSNSLPPWPSMNADITCTHNASALTKGLRGKKRLMDGRCWFFLRKFYPQGPQFKYTTSDCCTCSIWDEEKRVTATVKKEMGLRVRRSGCLSGPLGGVLARKSGVPSHLLIQKMIPVHQSDWAEVLSSSPSTPMLPCSPTSTSIAPEMMTPCTLSPSTPCTPCRSASSSPSPSTPPHTPSTPLTPTCVGAPMGSSMGPIGTGIGSCVGSVGSFEGCVGSVPAQGLPPNALPSDPSVQYLTQLLDSAQPLLPGLYNLVPRSWLKSWRLFHKDLSVTSVPPLDCTELLCHSHGLLVVPPHVVDYLVRYKRSLLGGLGAYQGSVVEILSAEEWNTLQGTLNSLSDFSVRFCLDGENVSWNTGVCCVCSEGSVDPGPQQSRLTNKKWP